MIARLGQQASGWTATRMGERVLALGEHLAERPAVAIGALCLAQIVMWTLAPALSHDAPPLDVVEGYLWGKHLPLATYKHPALPSWVLEATRSLTGVIGWPAYLISQVFVALTFVGVYHLGRDILGSRRAATGAILLTGIFYFVWPSLEFNHNVAQMPIWVGLALAVWRAVDRQSTAWWIAAGVIAGIGVYAKLYTLVLIATAGLWVVSTPRGRNCLRTPGPWIGLLIFAALFAPLVDWLYAHQFQSVTYAIDRGRNSGRFGLVFVGEQILVMAPMLIALGIAGIFRPTATRPSPAISPAPALRPIDETRFLHFLVFLTLGPIVVTVLGSLASGIGLKGTWGTPGLSLVGLIVVILAGERLSQVARVRLVVMTAAFLILVPIGYALSSWYAPSYGRPKRQNYPQAQIASDMRRIYREATGRPLTIVVGEHFNWIGGLVALSPRDMADAAALQERDQTPWITPERMAREGALIVWEDGGNGPPERMKSLLTGLTVSYRKFAWPRYPGVAPLVVGYAILPPG